MNNKNHNPVSTLSAYKNSDLDSLFATTEKKISLHKILRVFYFTFFIVVAIFPLWLFGRGSRKFGRTLARFGHNIYSPILGVKVRVHGRENLIDGPILMIGNHQSWLDIPIIGKSFPCTFIGSTDLENDKILGFLSDIQHTIYVDRANRSAVKSDADKITRYLNKGERIILFPEATTSNGFQMIKFKSGLFSIADNYKKHNDKPLPIQPITVHFSRAIGMPINRRSMPNFAWYGDMAFGSSVKNICDNSPLEVDLIIHPKLDEKFTHNRKVTAQTCERIIREAREKLYKGAKPSDVINLS